MLDAFNRIVHNIALGPQIREVKNYLDAATIDSVTSDLGKVFNPQLPGFPEREHLQTVFNKYCVHSPSQQKYWTEESFSKYLGANASASTVVDEEIRLLWRSFHFYAHHPFPRHLQDGMVDFAAFHRGVLLLVFQCDELLGTRELEFYWRNEAEFFRRASFRRVFQSIGVADTTILPHATISAVSDAMDALVMVGPQYMHAAPSPRQLELVARKLLSDPVCVSARKTSRQDVFLLIGLLLCLCSRKKRWSSVCHHGDFAVKSPAQQELTESLVNSLSGETMTDQQLEGAEEVMPNLQLRFYQLWAVLLQPAVANTSASKTDNLTQEPEIVASHIASSIALFAPQHTNDGIRLYQRIGQDARLILKRVVTSPDPQDISVIRLVQGLTHTEYGSGNIVLFTGDTVNRAPEVVMGAYFPGITTIDHSTGVEQDRKEFRATIPPVLFQLLPIFCLLRLTKGDLTLAEVIKSEDSDIHLDEILSMAEGAKSSQAAYQISSAMNDMGATLRVDPEKRTVELSGDNGHRYRDLKENRNTSLNCERKPVIQNARMDLLTVVEAEV